jgi:xanthosine utilization system XapX-like protein
MLDWIHGPSVALGIILCVGVIYALVRLALRKPVPGKLKVE